MGGGGGGWRTGSGKIPDRHPSPPDFTSSSADDKKPQYAPLTLRIFPSENIWKVECIQGVSASFYPHTDHSLDIDEAKEGDIKVKLRVDILI